MKKTLLRVVCAIVVAMMALSMFASAETKIGFNADTGANTETTLYVAAGYKDAHFANADGGAFVANGAAGHSIWAIEKANLATVKYLHFVVNTDAANSVLRVGAYHGYGWDMSKLQIFNGLEKPADATEYGKVTDTANGKEYVIDLSTLPAWDDESASYTYFDIALAADTPVNFDIYLTDTDPNAQQGDDPAVETADMIGIFATIAAAAAAVVVFTKKH